MLIECLCKNTSSFLRETHWSISGPSITTPRRAWWKQIHIKNVNSWGVCNRWRIYKGSVYLLLQFFKDSFSNIKKQWEKKNVFKGWGRPSIDQNRTNPIFWKDKQIRTPWTLPDFIWRSNQTSCQARTGQLSPPLHTESDIDDLRHNLLTPFWAPCQALKRHLVNVLWFLYCHCESGSSPPLSSLSHRRHRSLIQGMTVDIQKVHWSLPATVWRFYKDAQPVLQKPGLQASLCNPWTDSRCQVSRWPPDGRLSPRQAPQKAASQSGVFWIQLLCCLKHQERDPLLKRPSRKRRTVGLNIRKQKNSKKKIQFPNTTCSPSLLCNKSFNSFVPICSLESN